MPNPCDQLEEYGVAQSTTFGAGLTSLIASLAMAASILISSENAVCTATATGQSTLVAPPENSVSGSAAGSSTLLDRLVATNLLVSTSAAQSLTYVASDGSLSVSANATSALVSGKTTDVDSTGAAASTAFTGATRAPAQITEQATATSTVLANPENISTHSANATSSATTNARASTVLAASGNAAATVFDDYLPAVDATTTARASSVLLDALHANTIVVDTADVASVLFTPPSSQAWVANLETHAMWRYKDFAPMWLASINGAVVGLSADGLCEAAPAAGVDWYIETGWSDLGEQHKKRLTYTYVGGEYPAGTKLEVAVDMVPGYIGYALIGKRATIGKGLNARYWRFRVSGTGAGSLLDIRSDVAVSTRRI